MNISTFSIVYNEILKSDVWNFFRSLTDNSVCNFQTAFKYTTTFTETCREGNGQEGKLNAFNTLRISGAMIFIYLILS